MLFRSDGKAISFCDVEERPYLKDIEKLIKLQIPVVNDHPYPSLVPVTAVSVKPAQRGNGKSTAVRKNKPTLGYRRKAS